MKPSSIFAQLVVFALVIVSAAMALSFAIALALPPPAPGRMSLDEMEWALRRKPSWVIDTSTRNLPPTGVRSGLIEAALATALKRQGSDIRAVWVNAPDGSPGRGQTVVLIDNRDVLIDATATGFQLRYGPSAKLRNSTLVPLFIAAVKGQDGRWLWGIPKDPARNAWLQRIAAAFAVGMLAAWPLAALLSRRIAKPVEHLGKAAGLAKVGDKAPFPTEGPRELRATAEAMNTMHERIRNQADERIRLLAGLAHDLRTPLTALRLRAEGIAEPLRQRMTDDIGRMTDMVSEMLDRATIGAYEPARTSFDLSGLVQTCCNLWVEAGGAVLWGGGNSVMAQTDPILARRLIENLLDNALRYGTRASVVVFHHAGSAIVTIEDDGPGIPDDRMADALKPFSRLEPTGERQGTGLGLAIASQISEAIGATIELTNLSPGLRANVRFPGAVISGGNSARAEVH